MPSSLVITKMKIKAAIRYHCKPAKLAKVEKTSRTNFLENVEKRNSYVLLVGI
jgi:hypothetical protein